MKRYWYIEDRLLGTSIPRPRRYGGEIGNPVGFSYFCPECARLWANCVIPGRKSVCWTIPCAEHEHDAGGVPGSVFLSWEPEFVAEAPPEVISHEFAVHLRYAASTFTEPIASMCQAIYDVITPHK